MPERQIIHFRTAAARLQPDRHGALPLPPLLSYVPDWEVSLVALNRRPKGIKKYVWTLKKIIIVLGGDAATMDDLTYRAIVRYNDNLAAQGYTASTQINDLAVIRSFSRWAIREGLRIDDPTDGIVRPAKPVEAPRALIDEEFDHVLMRINTPPDDMNRAARYYWRRNRLAVVIMLLTGLRICEAVDLLWSDLKLKQRSLTVRCGKGGKAGVVPICEELYDELMLVPADERAASLPVLAQYGANAGQKMTEKGLSRALGRWFMEIAIKDVTAHRLRHTFASQLLYNDVDLRRIQRLLRHANLTSTQRYLLLRDKDLDEAVNTLTLKRPTD